MKKRARIVSGLAALAALFLAPLAEASITRASTSARETPALALTLAAPEPSDFSLFEGTELTAAAAEPGSAENFHPLAAVSLLSKNEAEAPLVSVDELIYPKTRYRVFGLLGTSILGELRGVSLELHWRSASFSCGFASGTVGWLSQDPMGDVDSPNLYGFVGARPHEKTDPLGLEASLSNNGTIVIADVHTGRIRRISPAEIAANGDEVRAALGLEAGLDPREADAMMKRAGGGVWTNNAKVTALSKGVSEEVNRELRFVAKTYAVTAGATVAGVAAGALGAGALVTGAVSGVGGLATSDVIEGHVSSPGTYAGAAVGGAIFAKVFGAFSIGEGPSTLGLDLPPPMLRGTNQPGMVTRRGSFRKATLDDAWDTAPPGSAGGRLCPTCGEEVTVPPGTGQARDWHGSHNPSWTKREFPPDVTRAEVLDEYQRGVTLECPRCNLGRGNRDELR